MKKKLLIFFTKHIVFSLRRQSAFTVVFLIIFSQNIYAVPTNYKTLLYNTCRSIFSSIHQTIQSKSQKLQKERNVILSKPVKYRGPDGYKTYLKEHPKSLLGASFKNILFVFSKEELELMEWHYIEFDSMKFGKIIQITGQTVLVDYIDNTGITTRTFIQKQLRTAQPSSIARGRMRFRSALQKMEFTEDERYIRIYSQHPLDQYGRVLEIQTKDLVIAEIIGHNGKLRKIQLSQNHLLRAEVDPVSKDWFNRIEHAIEKLEPIDVFQENKKDNVQTEFPDIFEDNTESYLEKHGYKNTLIKGVNEANRQVKLAERIRSFDINPFSTHIEDFALQIPNHIETIRQGIESQGIQRQRQRLHLLKQFEKEAHQKIEDSAVTYIWWLYWNKRLSILVTPSSQRKEKGDWWKSKKNLEHFLNNLNEDQLRGFHKDEYILMKLIQKFPYQIIFPTTSDLGPMAFNRVSVHSIFPVQLAGKATWMDGELHTPEKAFFHDINHAVLQFEEEGLSSSSLMKLFYQQTASSNNLTVYEREVIEIIYFLITHEKQWMDISQPQTVINMMMDKNIQRRFQDKNNLRNWIKEYIKDNTLQSYLRKMAEVFNRSSAPILKKIQPPH